MLKRSGDKTLESDARADELAKPPAMKRAWRLGESSGYKMKAVAMNDRWGSDLAVSVVDRSARFCAGFRTPAAATLVCARPAGV